MRRRFSAVQLFSLTNDDGLSELVASLSLHVDSTHTNTTPKKADTAGWYFPLHSSLTLVHRRRMYATTMKTIENPSTDSLDTTPPTPSPLPRRPRGIRQFHILASVLLSRPPLLLPDIDPFDYQIQRYQEYIQRHQYTRFPLNFFFKKGSIGERQWKRQHPDITKTSGSGLLRDSPDESGQRGPEWILGGNHDIQVMAARKNAGAAAPRKEKKVKEETLTDQERRDLEQYAQQEAGLLNEVKTLPRWINRDQRRLERHPEQTVYCLVKRSIPFHEKSGTMGPRKYTLIAEEALGFDEGHQPEGLHMVCFPLQSQVDILMRIGCK